MSRNCDYKISKLTTAFYNRIHSKNNFVEIMDKESRPYLTLILTVKNINFAIPFRTNISHNYCFKTIPHYINESSEIASRSGLDYTKAVIITENDLDGKIAKISDLEYSLVSKNIRKIRTEFKKYVGEYITIRKAGYSLSGKYLYSTL